MLRALADAPCRAQAQRIDRCGLVVGWCESVGVVAIPPHAARLAGLQTSAVVAIHRPGIICVKAWPDTCVTCGILRRSAGLRALDGGYCLGKAPYVMGRVVGMKRPARPMWQRTAYATAGFVALGLGLLGVALPGLPTTPFILLAAACFARSSQRVHNWLLTNRLTGPMLRDWVRHRSLPRKVRWIAIGSMTAMISLSIWILRDEPWLQIVLVLAWVVGAWAVLRIPLRK